MGVYDILIKAREYERIFAFCIASACYGDLNTIEKILCRNFDLEKKDYLKLKEFLEHNYPKLLWEKIKCWGDMPYVSRESVRWCRSLYISPDIPTQIALKTIHDNVKVNSKMIKEIVKNHGYQTPSGFSFGVLEFLRVGEKISKDEFVAFPEKMEIVWEFLTDENYVVPKKLNQLFHTKNGD